MERDSLEIEARGCQGPQPDPWDKSLTWPECPVQATFKRHDIDDYLLVKSLAAMSPLKDWPDGYAAHVADTWAMVDHERALMRDQRRPT